MSKDQMTRFTLEIPTELKRRLDQKSVDLGIGTPQRPKTSVLLRLLLSQACDILDRDGLVISPPSAR